MLFKVEYLYVRTLLPDDENGRGVLPVTCFEPDCDRGSTR